MKGCIIKLWLSCLLFICSLSCAVELPVESFSQLPAFYKPKLSADGNYIAYIENVPAGSEGLSVLVTLDLSTGKQNYLLQSDNEGTKIKWFRWANNKTLLVSVVYSNGRNGVDFRETRMFAMEADGSDQEARVLIKPNFSSDRNAHISQFQDQVIDMLEDDPEHILIALDKNTANLPDVYKLNIYDRQLIQIQRGKRQIRNWMSDQQSRVRLGVGMDYKKGDVTIYVRQSAAGKLEKLFSYNSMEEPAIRPVGFDLDPNILYYTAYLNDKQALYKINLANKESQLVFADPDYDVQGELLYSSKSRKAIGVYHSHSESGRIYWDEEFDHFQKSINHVLPDTHNYLVDFSQDEDSYILYSENDHIPGIYYLGQRKAKSLNFLFQQYPALQPEVLSGHQLLTYTARDGTKIEGYLTLPKNVEGPIATILLPHGGPGVREFAGFDYWTSFFSNRGYAVFRPNFRGSSGYGYEFAQSQMQGWGLVMQDDLTDAANWLIEKKIADPTRICIVGASYGGYAAIMAAVKTPDLFKCAVSFAGVSNLRKLVSRSRDYLGSRLVKHQIGSDVDDLEARSPYYQVDKVKIPLLIVHGEDDAIVDVEQSRMLAGALKDLAKQSEYIELANGDHHLSIQRNRHILFKAMDRFLKQQLK